MSSRTTWQDAMTQLAEQREPVAIDPRLLSRLLDASVRAVCYGSPVMLTRLGKTVDEVTRAILPAE